MLQSYLRDAAWRYILDQGICALPVQPTRIIKASGWCLYTYSQFAKKTGYTVPDIISKFNPEAFVFWSQRVQNYVICYNASYPVDVIRWSLMHEIAHIVLGHISADVPTLTRVRAPQRSIFEVEAQGFARRVLCPSIVLHACRAIEPVQIMQLCGISRTAAEYRSTHMHELEIRNRWRIHPLERAVEHQFRIFILKYFLMLYLDETA